MRSSLTAAPAQSTVETDDPGNPPSPGGWRGGEAWPAAGCRTRLIDTRLVRAELARLRGPRPGTEIPRARAIRSTVSGCA